MMKKWLTWLWRLRSHDLMSANSRSRKASNIISLSLEAWEPGEPTHVVLNPVSQSKGWRMWDEMSQPKEAGRKQTGKISPSLPVVLFRHSRGWMMPPPPHYWAHWHKCESYMEIVSYTHPESVPSSASWAWRTKLTIVVFK